MAVLLTPWIFGASSRSFEPGGFVCRPADQFKPRLFVVRNWDDVVVHSARIGVLLCSCASAGACPPCYGSKALLHMNSPVISDICAYSVKQVELLDGPASINDSRTKHTVLGLAVSPSGARTVAVREMATCSFPLAYSNRMSA